MLLARTLFVLATVLGAGAAENCHEQLNQGKEASRAGRGQEADGLLQQALACATSSKDNQLQARVLTELGVFSQQQGQYTAARSYMEQALQRFEQDPVSQQGNVAAALNNLAAENQLLGRLGEADALNARALGFWQRAQENNTINNPGFITSLANSAAMASGRGDFARAETLLTQARTLSERYPESAERAGVLNQLGVLYSKLGRPGAEALLRESLALRERLAGPNNIETATVLSNLGHELGIQGRIKEGEEYLRRAYDVCKASGAFPVRCATMLNNMASIEDRTGRAAEAETHWKEALNLFGADPAGDVSALAAVLNNLGKLYSSQHRSREALPLFERALGFWEHVNGEGSPEHASILTNLGALYVDQHKYDVAQSYFERARAMDVKALGPDHWRVATDFGNLAVTAVKRKRFDEADELFRRALAINERVFGLESIPVAQSLANLAELNVTRKQYEAAAAQFGRAFSIWGRETKLAPGTELGLLEHFSQSLKQIQDYAGAERVAMRAMSIRVKLALRKSANA